MSVNTDADTAAPRRARRSAFQPRCCPRKEVRELEQKDSGSICRTAFQANAAEVLASTTKGKEWHAIELYNDGCNGT
eukprot:2094937-Pleurochrysis_carterae.AAC.2